MEVTEHVKRCSLLLRELCINHSLYLVSFCTNSGGICEVLYGSQVMKVRRNATGFEIIFVDLIVMDKHT